MSTRVVIYGAFKGMGDLLNAAPVIKYELDRGAEVTLLLFSNMSGFPELLDFGPGRDRLRKYLLPVSGRISEVRRFFREMSALSPDVVWVSPHAPAPAASWKIPLLLWVAKRLYWPGARLCGVASEPLSGLFDIRVDVDRGLPFASREWQGYMACCGEAGASVPVPIRFKPELQGLRQNPPLYDLLIHPGAGAENRKWPPSNYRELLNCIPSKRRVAVMGLPDDLQSMRQVLGVDRQIEWLAGTLKDVVTAIGRAKVVLAMDSGTNFFAATLGTPGVALFGASDPANIIGYETSMYPLYKTGCQYQPCGSTRCRQPSLLCMQALEPAFVAAELNRLLHQADYFRP